MNSVLLGYTLHGSYARPRIACVVQKSTRLEPTPAFWYPVSSWFFSNKCPFEQFRTILSIQNKEDTRFGFWQGTSRTATERSTAELYPLYFRNSTKHPVFTRIPILVRKCYSLQLLFFHAFLLRFPFQTLPNVFPGEEFFYAGPMHTVGKYCTISCALGLCYTRQGTVFEFHFFYLVGPISCFLSSC